MKFPLKNQKGGFDMEWSPGVKPSLATDAPLSASERAAVLGHFDAPVELRVGGTGNPDQHDAPIRVVPWKEEGAFLYAMSSLAGATGVRPRWAEFPALGALSPLE